MQIIESTSWAVRSARISLRQPKGNRTVTLFPMIHIGDQAFYDRVYPDALGHDVVLLEGINSPVVRRITRSYRWLANCPSLGLVVQPKLVKPEGCPARIVRSDLSPEEFAAAWAEVPLWLRTLVNVASPIIGFRRRSSTRAAIAKGMSFEDAASQKELVGWSPELGFLETAILDARDQRLLEHIHGLLADNQEDNHSIGVVYGAHHMRAVLRDLMGLHGFICSDSVWMTVFTT